MGVVLCVGVQLKESLPLSVLNMSMTPCICSCSRQSIMDWIKHDGRPLSAKNGNLFVLLGGRMEHHVP